MLVPDFTRHSSEEKEYILDHLYHYQDNFKDRFTVIQNEFPKFFNDNTKDYFYLFCLWLAHQLSLAKYNLPPS